MNQIANPNNTSPISTGQAMADLLNPLFDMPYWPFFSSRMRIKNCCVFNLKKRQHIPTVHHTVITIIIED